MTLTPGDQLADLRSAFTELTRRVDVVIATHNGRLEQLTETQTQLLATAIRLGERVGRLEQDVAVNSSKLNAHDARLDSAQARVPAWAAVAVAAVAAAVSPILASLVARL